MHAVPKRRRRHAHLPKRNGLLEEAPLLLRAVHGRQKLASVAPPAEDKEEENVIPQPMVNVPTPSLVLVLLLPALFLSHQRSNLAFFT